MPKSVESKESKGLVKNIPLKNVIVDQRTNSRTETCESRIDFFYDLYKNDRDHGIDPIEVLLIQTGDPKTIKYLVIEGVHRFTALSRMGAKEVSASIHTEPFITFDDLENRKTRAKILYLSCKYNSRSNLPLSLQCRLRDAKELYENHYTPENIAQALSVSIRTALRWIEHMKSREKLEQERQLKQSQKEKAEKLLREGKSLRQTAKETGLNYRTVEKIKNDKETARQQSDRGAALCHVSQCSTPETLSNILHDESGHIDDIDINNEGNKGNGDQTSQSLDLKDPVGKLPFGDVSAVVGGYMELTAADKERVLDIFAKIYDFIRTCPWFPEVDKYALSDILSILSSKSKNLHKAIKGGGFKKLYERARTLNDERLKEINEAGKTIRSKEDMIKQLNNELGMRKEHCKSNCEFSREKHREEIERSLGYLLDTLNSLKKGITEGYLTDINKKTINVPKEAHPAFHQLILNTSYVTLSHFEAAVLHDLHNSGNMISFLEKFIDIAEVLKLTKRKDIAERIRDLLSNFGELNVSKE
jgi:transposase-like protein